VLLPVPLVALVMVIQVTLLAADQVHELLVVRVTVPVVAVWPTVVLTGDSE
jgi:hypothetical protein